jgi:hypothetical protein
MNPLEWKSEHQIALLICAGIGFLIGVPVVNSIVLAVDRESRDAGTRCWICVG